MYATLSLKRLLAIIGYPLIGIFLILILRAPSPMEAAALLRAAGMAIAIWGGILTIFGGSAKWWSPWRLIWRIQPLNSFLFPDLNGKWRGTTSSNWPVIKAMLDAAEGNVNGFDREQLAQIPLEDGMIEMEIRASFFKFIVTAELSATGATSKSLTETLRFDERTDQFELDYIYKQDTPEPQMSDEASHPGAASLLLDMAGDKWRLEGTYWTMRRWRSGLNTAGRISVERISR